MRLGNGEHVVPFGVGGSGVEARRAGESVGQVRLNEWCFITEHFEKRGLGSSFPNSGHAFDSVDAFSVITGKAGALGLSGADDGPDRLHFNAGAFLGGEFHRAGFVDVAVVEEGITVCVRGGAGVEEVALALHSGVEGA